MPPSVQEELTALRAEVAAVYRVLDAQREELQALREAIAVLPGALAKVHPPPEVAAPLASGGGASPPDFPTSFRGRTGGAR